MALMEKNLRPIQVGGINMAATTDGTSIETTFDLSFPYVDDTQSPTAQTTAASTTQGANTNG